MFGFFKRHTVEMSPEVRGRITEGGKPVSGLQVARSLIYEGYQKGKEHLEHTFTNDNGEFSFQPFTIKSRMPGDLFGQNFPVMQAIYIERGDQLFSLWSVSKVTEPIEPLSKLMLRIEADLLNTEVQHLIDASRFGGRARQSISSICHWQGELISTYYNNELVSSYEAINAIVQSESSE